MQGGLLAALLALLGGGAPDMGAGADQGQAGPGGGGDPNALLQALLGGQGNPAGGGMPGQAQPPVDPAMLAALMGGGGGAPGGPPNAGY